MLPLFVRPALSPGRDYHIIINPLVKNIAAEFGKISYLLVLNTSLKNYTMGAWIQDALLGLRYFSKWKKLAIVTEKDRDKEVYRYVWKVNSSCKPKDLKWKTYLSQNNGFLISNKILI